MHKQLTQVQEHLNDFKEGLAKEDTIKAGHIAQLDETSRECKELEETNKVLTSVLLLLEQCNIAARDFVKVEVEQLVTQGLRSIFEDDTIQFNIDFITKRNQIEAEFTLSREEDKTRIQGDILSTYGGGVVDVISISLRIIIMQLMKVKGPLILDEPGKNISAQFISAFGKFLTEVSNTFDRQIVMITHNSKLVEFANNIIEVYQTNGVSHTR
ncbi:hypothetical protein LCGC14_1150900 [marine sediment metagenome]|uniref:RecF/RecN/SMC N-terminal domain-containing protein n=1 Tax=marine sediment metagenome TaxID=412755 RepID=A0A0F9LVH8_9ZZZZ